MFSYKFNGQGVKILHDFQSVKSALKYIDNHLDEHISLDLLANKFHFSPFYFHRMFSAIVGKTIAAHIRDRRLLSACKKLVETNCSILSIALDSGYDSAPSFSRAFKRAYRLSPSEYRRQRLKPSTAPIDEMIMKFTNRLRGGIYLNPKIIALNEITIAGTSGDGKDTWSVWETFEVLNKEKPLKNKTSENRYEVRIYEKAKCTVFTGQEVSDENIDSSYSLFKIPKARYASFDVYVANGYDSENSAMKEWLETNEEGYTESLLDNHHYCVEFYDERFNGKKSESILEIWIPIEKKKVTSFLPFLHLLSRFCG